MLKFLPFILLSFSAFSQNSSPKLDPNKYTVCAITINSDDEKKVFQSHTSKYPDKFNPVVELTTLGDKTNWFKKACESGIKCDQLLISGHFAGSFFSEESELNLDLKEMEKEGCSKTCEGILNNPQEVFLFGCNTLAGKEPDARTPAQYLQVLLRDGIPLPQAELIVQSRYGEVGDSNKASMQRAFGGEPKQLYGFSSVGPLGKNIKGFLENYFKKHNPVEHLDKLVAKRITNQIGEGNKLLAESLKSTSFAECSQADLKDEKTKNICTLLDQKTTLDQKLEKTVELLGSDQALVYLPVISHFMETVLPDNLTDSQKQTFKSLTENTVIKSQIIGLIQKTHGLGLKINWLNLATKLTYITLEEKNNHLLSEVSSFFAKPLKPTDVEVICNLSIRAVDIKLTEAHLKNKTIKSYDIYGYLCLGVEDRKIFDRVFKLDPKGNKEMMNAIRELASIAPNDYKPLPAFVWKMIRSDLKAKDEAKICSALFDLNRFLPGDKEAVARAKELLPTASPGCLKSLAEQTIAKEQK